MTSIELRAKRTIVIAQGRELHDKARRENRELTADENQQWDRILAEADALRTQIDRIEKQEKLEAELAQSAGRRADPNPAGEKKPGEIPAEFRYTLRNGRERVYAVSGPRSDQNYRNALNRYLRDGRMVLSGDEFRALQADSNILGGYLVAPQQMVFELLKTLDDSVFIRQNATVLPPLTTAASLGVPSLDADPSDSDWTSELATGSEDSAMRFGKRALTPHPLAKRIKVSQTLLRLAAMSAEQIVRDRLAYKYQITQEKAFQTGNGSQRPLGVFTASADGISTARDVLTGSATNFTFDGLISAKYALKYQYHPRARWLFHRDGIKLIAKLKDTTNQYLWQPSNQAGQPDRLLGFPVDFSEYTPNTFTAGLYVGMLADWSYYWIQDALDVNIIRLDELYAETNQVGFISRLETDGMPVLEEPFVRLRTD